MRFDGPSVVWLALQKKAVVATERDDGRWEEWRTENASLDTKDLVIVDETISSFALSRRYGSLA